MAALDDLQPREPQRRREHAPRDDPGRDAQHAGGREPAPSGKGHDRQRNEEAHERCRDEEVRLGEAPVHAEGDRQGQPDHVGAFPLPAVGEDRERRDPAEPGHHARQRPGDPGGERAREHEHDPAQHRGERSQAEHAAQRVGSGPRDEQLHRHDDEEREPERDEIAREVGQAQHSGLEIEELVQPEQAHVVPQRELEVVDRRPVEGVEGHHLGDRVADQQVVRQVGEGPGAERSEA